MPGVVGRGPPISFQVRECEVWLRTSTRRPSEGASGGRVGVYDPSKASRKRYVGTFDTQQKARAAGRLAGVAHDRGPVRARWLDLHPRQKESTNIGDAAQIKPFVAIHGALPLRDVTVDLALEWALERRWTQAGARDVQRSSPARPRRPFPSRT